MLITYAISPQYRVADVKICTMTQKEGNNVEVTFLGSKANSSISLLQIVEKYSVFQKDILEAYYV